MPFLNKSCGKWSKVEGFDDDDKITMVWTNNENNENYFNAVNNSRSVDTSGQQSQSDPQDHTQPINGICYEKFTSFV